MPVSQKNDMDKELRKRLSKYVYISKLGKGSFGDVTLQRNKKSGDLVAIKTMRNRYVEMHGNLPTEVFILRHVKHPNLIKLRHFYIVESLIILVMEYIKDGKTLLDYCKGKPASEIIAAPIFKQLISALSYMHEKGFAHLDVKPLNIYVSKTGNIKLLDFGESMPIDDPVNEPKGTFGYRAPEITSAKTSVFYPGPADVFSSGLTLKFILTGRNPMPPQAQVKPSIPDPTENFSSEVKELLKGMLHTNPCYRMTQSEVLQHQWIQAAQEPCPELW